MQAILIALLHSPMPATVDSMCVAGLIELHRTKGLWKASVRYGYAYGGLRDAGDLAARSKGGATEGLWTKARMDAVAAVFEEQWALLLGRNAGGKAADVESGGKVAAIAASLTAESLRAEFIDVMETRMRSMLRDPARPLGVPPRRKRK